MKLFQILCWNIFVSAVFCCGIQAASDFKIGPDNALDSLTLCPGNAQYLVIWRDLRNGDSLPQIRGSTISQTGVISADFAVSNAAGLPAKAAVQRQTVAFDGTNYLTVWVDTRASGTGLRGTRLDANGTVLGGGDFLISALNQSTGNTAPLLVFTGLDYVVAWQDAPLAASGTQIYFCRISTAGLSGPPSALPSSVSVVSQSLEFLVHGPANEVLLVYQDAAFVPTVTRATRIQTDNSFDGDAAGTLLFKNDFSTAGFGAPVGAAFDGTQYHILSSFGAQMDSSVFKTRLTPGSAPIRPSAPFAEVGQGVTQLSEDNFPRAYFNSNGAGEFLFLRNSKVSDTAYHVLSKRVTLDGTDRDPNFPLQDSAPRGILNGAVAASLGTQYLVVWMDGRRPAEQPAAQVNLYGILIEGSLVGDETKPYLKAVARATPFFGNPPLTVAFGIASSTGLVDSYLWDFGDGTTSLIPYPTHIYKTKGDYIAVLSLLRAGVYYRDFVRIFVNTDALGGGGGPPETIGGALGPLSDNLDTDTFIATATIDLNFTASGKDAIRILGFFDPSGLPVNSNAKTGTFSIAGRDFPFTLDANALFVSATGSIPVTKIGLNSLSGTCQLNTTSNDLSALLAAYGCGNETTEKKGKTVSLPASLSFANQSLSTTLTGTYTAQSGKTGRFVYQLGSVGHPSTGLIQTFTATATEAVQSKTNSSHTFAVTGFMSPGGNATLVKSDTGGWRISFGNYSETIPGSDLTLSGSTVSYASKIKKKQGVYQFYFNNQTRTFGVYLRGVTATGNNPSGMALFGSQFLRADMAMSFDFDLQGATKFQASTFVRFVRPKLSSKKWALR